jgi:hypothetical protein
VLSGWRGLGKVQSCPDKKLFNRYPKTLFSYKTGLSLKYGIGEPKKLHDKKFQSEELDWQVLGGLIDDLRSGCSEREKRAADALASNAALERFLFHGGYEMDERTGRRHGKSIREKYAQTLRIVGAVEYDSWQVRPTPCPE